jgi:chemotaxis signal transduction protein
MRQMVRFRAGGCGYAVAVETVRQVRTAAGLSPLPSGRPGVAGFVVQQGEPLPVLSVLGPDRDRLLVLEANGRRFGLLVEGVDGVVKVDEDGLGPAPEGQDLELVTAVARVGGTLLLVVDVGVLAARVLD